MEQASCKEAMLCVPECFMRMDIMLDLEQFFYPEL